MLVLLLFGTTSVFYGASWRNTKKASAWYLA